MIDVDKNNELLIYSSYNVEHGEFKNKRKKKEKKE